MNTNVIALVSGFGWHVQDLKRAADQAAIPFHAVPFSALRARVAADSTHILAGSLALNANDAVLVRMMPPGSLEQVVFRMDALHALQTNGTLVVNPPRAVETAVDKFLTLARLQAAGLPVPLTYVVETARDALRAFEDLGGDVVIKPLFGSEGRGLVRLADRETASRVFHALERIHSVLYVQKYQANMGYDLRVLVLAGRVIAAMRRFPKPGDWRANLAQGGKAEPIEPDAQQVKLAIASARAVGAHWAGVDLLPTTRGECVVLEVNAVPGWKGLARVTGIDVASLVLDDLQRLMREGRRP